VGIEAVKDAVFMFSYPQLAFILLIIAASYVFMGSLRWRNIMRAIDAPMPSFSKLLLVKLVGFSLSYVTPAALFGGEPARFFILKTDDDKKNSALIASILLDKLLQFLSCACFFFAGILVLLIYLNLSFLGNMIIAGAVVLTVLLFIYVGRRIKRVSKEEGFFIYIIRKLYLNKLKSIKKMAPRLGEVEAEMREFFRKPKKYIVKTVLFTFLEVTLVLISFWLIIFFMGHVLTIPKVLVIRSMTDLSSVIPFPAALGTLEVTQAFVFESFGLGAATGVALSLIFRGVNLVLAFVGLIVFLCLQIRRFTDRIIDYWSKILPKI